MNKTKIIICGHLGEKWAETSSPFWKTTAKRKRYAASIPLSNPFPSPCTRIFSPEVKEDADVIVDFSSAENLEERLAYAAEKNIGIVLGSTGFHGGGQ